MASSARDGWSNYEGRCRRSVTGVQQGKKQNCNLEHGTIMTGQRSWWGKGQGNMASRFTEIYCMVFKHGFMVY